MTYLSGPYLMCLVCLGMYVHIIAIYHCRYNSDILVQIKTQIAPPKCKVKVCAIVVYGTVLPLYIQTLQSERIHTFTFYSLILLGTLTTSLHDTSTACAVIIG